MADSPLSNLIVRLPFEIHSLILKELDRDSLLKLRLTCKALNYQTIPRAFKRLHVWLEEESLQKLVNIANEPHLHKSVRFIDFGMDSFYDTDVIGFKPYVYPRLFTRYAYEGNTPGLFSLKSSWAPYLNHFTKHDSLKVTGRDFEMFAHAIAAFSALECIRLVDFHSLADGSNEGPRLPKRRTMLRPGIRNAPYILPPMPIRTHQLQILIRALAANSRTKLRNLTLHLYITSPTNHGFHSTLSAEDADLAKPAFSGLKTLTLSLPCVTYSNIEDGKETSRESTISAVLKAATQLEVLRIELPLQRRLRVAFHSIYWQDIVQPTCFGKLKTLSIKGGTLKEAEFVSFLTQSCQGLKRLDLSDVRMVEDQSWDLIFETIRSLPELTQLSFESLWCGPCRGGFMAFHYLVDSKPFYDYLLKRRDDNPWRGMCQAYIAERDKEQAEEQRFAWI